MEREDHEAIARAFHEAVNMTPAGPETWLDTGDSRAVGWMDEGETEWSAISGARIVAIKRARTADLTDDDAHMRKVVGYVHRHMAERPKGDVRDTRWRRSLIEWGQLP